MSAGISLHAIFEIAFAAGAGLFCGGYVVIVMSRVLDWAGTQIAQFTRRTFK